MPDGGAGEERRRAEEEGGCALGGRHVLSAARWYVDHRVRPGPLAMLDYIATHSACAGRGVARVLFGAVRRCAAAWCPARGGRLWVTSLDAPRIVEWWRGAGCTEERDAEVRALAEEHYTDCVVLVCAPPPPADDA